MARFFKEVGRRLHLVGPEETVSSQVSACHGDHKHLCKHHGHRHHHHHHHHSHHHSHHHHYLNGAKRSDNEEDAVVIPKTPLTQNQLVEIRGLVEKSWDFLWQCLTRPEKDWKLEAGKDREEGLVFSLHSKEYGKLFKLEGEVDMEPKRLWEYMIHNINSSPEWNPTLVECSTVQVIDNCTDISHNIAAGQGGVVSSRDFVNVRHWGQRQGMYLSAGHGVNHPDRPPVKKHVRGFNGPGGWAFKPVENDRNKCIFVWIMNLDLKGWIPQRLVDQASTTVLQDYLKYLRQHVADLRQNM